MTKMIANRYIVSGERRISELNCTSLNYYKAISRKCRVGRFKNKNRFGAESTTIISQG